MKVAYNYTFKENVGTNDDTNLVDYEDDTSSEELEVSSYSNRLTFMSLVATNHIFDIVFRIFPYDSKQCFCPFAHNMNMHTAFIQEI